MMWAALLVRQWFLTVLLSPFSSSFYTHDNCRKRYQPTITLGVTFPDELSTEVDKRPYSARANHPRKARRVNHAFKHLYRHISLDRGDEEISSLSFLMKYGNLTRDQVVMLNSTFPPLLTLHVTRHLYPKLLFLQRTLGCTSIASIPPSYFGSRLERVVAPRYAFMVNHGFLNHFDLLQNDNFLRFFVACKTSQAFTAYCNSLGNETITAIQVEAWDISFQRGLLSACRRDVHNSWTTTYVDETLLVESLITHGANPLEQDSRGATLLHWACGCGNLDAVKCLVKWIDVNYSIERDGGTSLHWAAAGASAREFGSGGHLDVCQFLLRSCNDAKRTINQVTKDGNSVLMWAAWSGTLPVVKWLIQNHANATVENRNGCTVAHWAASGGSLETCRYLKEMVGLDFKMPNHGGNTPLTHAVAFGRAEIVEWLLRDAEKGMDSSALQLAQDFVQWTGEDDKRVHVLSMFG